MHVCKYLLQWKDGLPEAEVQLLENDSHKTFFAWHPSHWGLVMPYASQNLVNIGNGLVPDGTKPIPEPLLAYCQLDRNIFQ